MKKTNGLTKAKCLMVIAALAVSVAAMANTELTANGSVAERATCSVVDNAPVGDTPDGPPEYPGGLDKMMKFIGSKLVYPERARKAGIEGRVLVGFWVDTDGSVTDVHIVESVDADLDNEAMRVVKRLPKWKPGIKEGKPVKVRIVFPITFRIPD